MATVFDPQTEPLVDSDMLYEIVDGEIVEAEPMRAYESVLASAMMIRLGNYVLQHGLGQAVSETLFDLATVHRQRRPDVAFVSKERWPLNKRIPQSAAWKVVPDLAVEVNSPSNTMDEVNDKVHEYFDAGVRLVWVIVPKKQEVYVYDSLKTIRLIAREDDLTGDTIIPGFRLPLAELFDEEPESDASA